MFTFARNATHAGLSQAELVLLELLNLSALLDADHWEAHHLQHGWRLGIVDVVPAPPRDLSKGEKWSESLSQLLWGLTHLDHFAFEAVSSERWRLR